MLLLGRCFSLDASPLNWLCLACSAARTLPSCWTPYSPLRKYSLPYSSTLWEKDLVFLLCVCLYAGNREENRESCDSLYVEVRGELWVVNFLLLPLWGSWVSNLDLQAYTTSNVSKRSTSLLLHTDLLLFKAFTFSGSTTVCISFL